MKHPPVIIVTLYHIQGPLKGKVYESAESKITIGRHPSCDVSFPKDLKIISRKHAEIIREGNRFKLLDHSTNGTFVNGKRIKDAYLKNGDVLWFAESGPKISFITKIRDGEYITSMPQEKSQADRYQSTGSTPLRQTPITPQEPEKPEMPAPKRVKASLTIQYGPTLQSFDELPITIGRNPNCDFKIENPSILDMHAQIFYSQNSYWIKDLTGRGLVHVNRKPVSTEEMLMPDYTIALSPNGPVFRFLGEGRLAEAEAPVDNSLHSDVEETDNSQMLSSQKKDSKKGPIAFFKKLIK